MATGLEVAALALAVFPLVVSTLEHYEDGFQVMKDWIRFRAEFTAFANALAVQKILFRQMIEDLLSSFVASDIDMARMLQDPNDVLWKDELMEDMLRRRLSGQHEYECFTSEVQEIYRLLERLCSKLKIDPNHVSTMTVYDAGY